MSTQKTANYQLNQWVSSDRIQMEDFNTDNQKVDTALKTLADQTAQIARCGNCKIVCGTYTGTGTYGESTPNSLDFDAQPLFVLVQGTAKESDADCHLRMVAGAAWAIGAPTNSAWNNVVTWGANSVSWYTNRAANIQFNTSGKEYCYLALLKA